MVISKTNSRGNLTIRTPEKILFDDMKIKYHMVLNRKVPISQLQLPNNPRHITRMKEHPGDFRRDQKCKAFLHDLQSLDSDSDPLDFLNSVELLAWNSFTSDVEVLMRHQKSVKKSTVCF
jgi:hypothetical protein